jgi:hypothetical protein
MEQQLGRSVRSSPTKGPQQFPNPRFGSWRKNTRQCASGGEGIQGGFCVCPRGCVCGCVCEEGEIWIRPSGSPRLGSVQGPDMRCHQRRRKPGATGRTMGRLSGANMRCNQEPKQGRAGGAREHQAWPTDKRLWGARETGRERGRRERDKRRRTGSQAEETTGRAGGVWGTRSRVGEILAPASKPQIWRYLIPKHVVCGFGARGC